jgi:hypothetical protein
MAANTNYLCVIQQTSTSDGTAPIIVQAPMPDSFMFDAKSTYDMALPQGFSQNKPLNLAMAAFGTKLTVQALTAQIWSGNQEAELSIELEFHTETDPVADVRNPIVNLLKLTMPSISTSFGLLQQPGPSLDLSLLVAGAGTALTSAVSSGVSVVSSLASSASGIVTSAFHQVTGTAPTAGSLNDSGTSSNDGANSTVPAATTQNPSLGTAAYWKSRVKNQISIRIGNYMFFDSVVITNVQQTFSSNFDAQTGLPHHAKVMVGFKPFFMLVQSDLDALFINPGSNGASSSNSTPATSSYGFSVPGAPAAASNTFGFSL